MIKSWQTIVDFCLALIWIATKDSSSTFPLYIWACFGSLFITHQPAPSFSFAKIYVVVVGRNFQTVPIQFSAIVTICQKSNCVTIINSALHVSFWHYFLKLAGCNDHRYHSWDRYEQDRCTGFTFTGPSRCSNHRKKLNCWYFLWLLNFEICTFIYVVPPRGEHCQSFQVYEVTSSVMEWHCKNISDDTIPCRTFSCLNDTS